MTRRNFFRSALACFGAMVLAPVRAATRRSDTDRLADAFRRSRKELEPYRRERERMMRELLASISGNLDLLGGKPPV